MSIKFLILKEYEILFIIKVVLDWWVKLRKWKKRERKGHYMQNTHETKQIVKVYIWHQWEQLDYHA